MSATMARQGGRVQLEQFDMRLALNLAKMAKEGFSRAGIGETKYLIKKPRAEGREENNGVLNFLGIKRWGLRYKDTRQFYVITKRLAAFVAKMAPQRIRRHAGDAKGQVHLLPPDAECGLQNRLHLHPARHPPQPVTHPKHNCLESSICRPDIRIRIHLFPVQNFSKMMRIPSTIPILIQICWLMMISTLSVVW